MDQAVGVPQGITGLALASEAAGPPRGRAAGVPPAGLNRPNLPGCGIQGYSVAMMNRWYAYFSLALEGPASN